MKNKDNTMGWLIGELLVTKLPYIDGCGINRNISIIVRLKDIFRKDIQDLKVLSVEYLEENFSTDKFDIWHEKEIECIKKYIPESFTYEFGLISINDIEYLTQGIKECIREEDLICYDYNSVVLTEYEDYISLTIKRIDYAN